MALPGAAGGYSAGYFSYKWAEVLSADAFSAFEEVLGDDAAVRDTGRRFRDTVLALGGGRAPDAVFRVRGPLCRLLRLSRARAGASAAPCWPCWGTRARRRV